MSENPRKDEAVEATIAVEARTSSSTGFLDRNATYIHSVTDAPSNFVKLAGLRTISIFVGRKAIAVTPLPVYTNLYLLFIAPSGKGRKTTMMEIMNNILADTVPTFRTSDSYTPEYLITQLAENSEARNEWDECHSVLSKMNNPNHYYSGISDALMRVYGCPDIVTVGTQAEGTKEIIKPYFNVLWMTTKKRYSENVKAQNIDDGFLAKMLCVYDEQTGKKRHRKNLKDVTNHSRDFDAIRTLVSTCYKVFHDADFYFEFSADALEVENKFEDEQEATNERLPEDEKELMNAVSTRLEEYFIKFSALYEIDSIVSRFKSVEDLSKFVPPDKIVISKSSADEAYALVNDLLDLLNNRVLLLLKESRFSKLVAKFAKLLEDGELHDRSSMSRLMHCNNAREFDTVKDELIRQGLIVQSNVGKTEHYHIVKQNAQ